MKFFIIDAAVCLQITFMDLALYSLKIQKCNACPDKIQRKTLIASIFGPLAVISNVALKCEQTALSQELSMVNKLLCTYSFIP